MSRFAWCCFQCAFHACTWSVSYKYFCKSHPDFRASFVFAHWKETLLFMCFTFICRNLVLPPAIGAVFSAGVGILATSASLRLFDFLYLAQFEIDLSTSLNHRSTYFCFASMFTCQACDQAARMHAIPLTDQPGNNGEDRLTHLPKTRQNSPNQHATGRQPCPCSTFLSCFASNTFLNSEMRS